MGDNNFFLNSHSLYNIKINSNFMINCKIKYDLSLFFEKIIDYYFQFWDFNFNFVFVVNSRFY